MERFPLLYSQKCIPIPSRREYTVQFVDKTESFLRRLRWKAFHFLHPQHSDAKPTFGFPTTRTPPQIPELANFESEMSDMVNRIKFRPVNDVFQNKLREDVNNIKVSDKILVHADKTPNIYKMDVNSYKKILTENVTSDYKKINKNEVNKINSEPPNWTLRTELTPSGSTKLMSQ